MTQTADQAPDEATPQPAPRVRLTPAPRPSESSAEQVVQVVEAVEQAAKGKSPILTILAIVVPLIAGGSMGVGGWSAQSEAKTAYESLAKKVDKLTEELSETRKELAATATTAAALRHEERIREVEKTLQAHDRLLDKQALEIETLKKR